MTKTSIHNLSQVFLFRGLAFGIVGLGSLALFSDYDDSVRIALFLLSLVVMVSLWMIVQPGYMAFETAQGHLLISTDKEDKNDFYLKFSINELAGYEIEKSYAGLRKVLYLYRKTPKGFLRSKPIPMSLYSPAQTRKMCEQLDQIVSQNGFGHLKL
ncbi:MAG: hypothetical protein ACK417_07605 [Bacteroidia bacterium]